jgi:hypothetical protein
MQGKGETLRSYIQQWSVIKNSTKDLSDERAVDASSAGLRRSDLVEELGRTRPKTVSELMEIASRFADGEDAYNNKRVCSPKVDRANRQRGRSRNEDGHGRCNQVAAGYERGDEEGNESREYQDKVAASEISQNILTHRQKTCFMDLAASTMHTWMARESPIT